MSVQGAAGVTGPTGPQGVVGPTGPTGADSTVVGPLGPTGPAGTDGTQGAQGLTGPTGPSGAEGIEGPQGNTGPTGPKGDTGNPGSPGPLGPTGPQGVPGGQGLTGGIGPVGPTGPSGTNGINGTNGTNGSVGPTGPAGPGANQALNTNSSVAFAGVLVNGSSVITSGNIGSQSVNYATSAGSADQIDGIPFRNTNSNSGVNADTLNSNGTTYYTAGVSDFSGNATDGALYSAIYSNDWQHQIAGDFRSGQIALRGKNSGTWQAWRTVWDSGNFNPASKYNYGEGGTIDVNSLGLGSKLYAGSSGSWTNRGPTGHNGSALLSIHTHPGNYYNQLWFNTSGNEFYHRSIDNGSINSWAKVWTDANFNPASYSLTSHTHTWGNISGGSVNDWGGLRHSTGSGYIDFGPANGSHAHIYTDRPNFYFNKDLLVNGNGVITSGNIGSQSVNYANSSGNADTVDGYHASSLWRSDGGTWNPGANISLSQTGNGQEWSFDISRNGYGGGYWHVWDSAHSTMLAVNAETNRVGVRTPSPTRALDVVGGIRTRGSEYNEFNTWTDLTGHHGLFSSVHNGAHFFPNSGSYGGWLIFGTRNGWAGLEFGNLNNGAVSLMILPSSNVSGFHNNSHGWQWRWESGTAYVNKSTYGGGTQAVVLDSSNRGSYAAAVNSTSTESGGLKTRLSGTTLFITNNGNNA